MSEPLFERLPMNGRLYRLVWAGRIATPIPDMATARVWLWLVEIDESDPKNLKWAYRPNGSLSVLVLDEAAGSIPKLVMGSFWRDRTLQTGYSMPDDMTVRNANIRPQRWQIVRAGDRVGDAGVFRIAADEYPLTGEDAGGRERRFQDAPLLRCFTDSGLELLIPCYEIFRRFYALTSELANAMLAGYWKRELSTLVDLEQTRLLDDGKTVEVFPQVDLRDIGCVGIAFFMMMASARKRVSEIFPAIENARRSGISEPWIFALPPWHDEAMSLSFVGQQLRSGAVLVLWINQSPFPQFPYNVIRIEPEVRIPIQSEESPPAGTPPREPEEKSSNPKIQPAADAGPSRAAVHLGLNESWTNLARIKRRALKKSSVPVNPEPGSDGLPKRKRRLTTGRRSESGRLTTASLSSDAQNAIVNRFNALAECFEVLLQAGDIQARNDYALINPMQIGDHSYCAFPVAIAGIPRPWAIVNPEDPRPRVCWVSEITALDGSFYYWIEVEALFREFFKALVVKPRALGGRLGADTLEAILKIGVVDKGQWKKAAFLTVNEHVTWVSARHSFASGQLRSSVVLGKLKSLG